MNLEDKAPGKVDLKLTGVVDGVRVEISLTTTTPKIRESIHYLKRHGVEFPPAPLVFERTADGLPICPKHQVPMRLREKQGDSWHSHTCYDASGAKVFCKGYAGPDSPGYHASVETPVEPERPDYSRSRKPALNGQHGRY